MSDYLQRIYIDEIEEVESNKQGAYAKYVDIVEIVDSTGEPWEPVPGPDPWDELTKAQAPMVVGNNFEPGTQITGQTGTFTGGNPDTTIYRWRWRWRPIGGNWTNGTWTNSTNEVIPVTYDIPANHWGYQIQLQSQARDETQDPVLQVINNSTTKVTVYQDLAVVQRTSTSGNVLVGSTLTGTLATYEGGDPPIVEEYQWQRSLTGDGNWQGITNWTSTNTQQSTTKTYDTRSADILQYVRFAGRAEDDKGNIAYGSGNAIGPIEDHKIFGDISVKINDIDYDHQTGAPLTILMNDPITVVVSITGNAQPTYTWEARNDYPLMVGQQAASTVLTFPEAGGPTVTCTLYDNTTVEKTTSIAMNFYVVDAFD